MASGPITSWQIDGGEMETVTDIFLHCKNHMDQKKKKITWTVTTAMKLKDTGFLEEKLWQT